MANSSLYNFFNNNELINMKTFDSNKNFLSFVFISVLLIAVLIQSGLLLIIKKLINYFLHFEHLDSVGQSYTEHFSDSICYSWYSLKSAFYFFCHSIYPDVFERKGSDNLFKLNSMIEKKIDKINKQN
jgi:hypothetical protein